MKKLLPGLMGITALLLITVPLHAQSGCTDSPENPTAILALVGSAGALVSSLRNRAKARRSSRQD